MLQCDNHEGVPVFRIVSNPETGEQLYYCQDCYTTNESRETPPEFNQLCEMCGQFPSEQGHTDIQSGLRLAVCHWCDIVWGRVKWNNADPDQWEALDERASALTAPNGNQESPKRRRKPKLAVHDGGNNSETLETPQEQEAVAVGANATAEQHAASDAED